MFWSFVTYLVTEVAQICVCSSSVFVFSIKGAGQDVGRSCILVSIGGKNIMLDCGMHMGYNDDVSEPKYSIEDLKEIKIL